MDQGWLWRCEHESGYMFRWGEQGCLRVAEIGVPLFSTSNAWKYIDQPFVSFFPTWVRKQSSESGQIWQRSSITSCSRANHMPITFRHRCVTIARARYYCWYICQYFVGLWIFNSPFCYKLTCQRQLQPARIIDRGNSAEDVRYSRVGGSVSGRRRRQWSWTAVALKTVTIQSWTVTPVSEYGTGDLISRSVHLHQHFHCGFKAGSKYMHGPRHSSMVQK